VLRDSRQEQIVLDGDATQQGAVHSCRAGQGIIDWRQDFSQFHAARRAENDARAAGQALGLGRCKATDVAGNAKADEMLA
jgi:hypothetical protein